MYSAKMNKISVFMLSVFGLLLFFPSTSHARENKPSGYYAGPLSAVVTKPQAKTETEMDSHSNPTQSYPNQTTDTHFSDRNFHKNSERELELINPEVTLQTFSNSHIDYEAIPKDNGLINKTAKEFSLSR